MLVIAGPTWALVPVFLGIAAVPAIALRRRLRGRDAWRYDTVAAWLRALTAFAVAWAVAAATGALATVVTNPLVSAGQAADPVWLVAVVVATLVVVVGYWVVWPLGTRAHGRRVVLPDTVVFGLLWGVSQGLLFASAWVTASRLLGGLPGGRVWVAVATIVVLSAYQGLWHALYWDVHVSPEHNVIEWNLRKVALVHTPNLVLTTILVTAYGNLGLWVALEAVALLGSAVTMRFPTFRRPHPEDPTRPALGPPAPLPSPVPGRTVVLTGGANGIGREAARRLAAAGAEVVVLDRDVAGGRAAVAELAAAGADAAFLAVDLADPDDVRRVASEVLARVASVDVLVHCAGVFTEAFERGPSGRERTLATNHLGPFLLTQLLRERLVASAARVVFVSSDAHWQAGEVDWDDLDGERWWKGRQRHAAAGFAAYNQSKLFATATAVELAERLAGTGVTVNAVTPGALVPTGIWDGASGFMAVLVRVLRPVLRPVEEAALGILYLATSPEVAGVSGWYLKDLRLIESSQRSRDPAFRDRVWRASEELVGTGAAAT